MKTRGRYLVALGLSAALVLSACGGDDGAASGGGSGRVNLNLVGFAVPKAGNNAAHAAWVASGGGEGVTWTESYGASGDQSRAVANGLKADYVHFSVGSDLTRLVDAGIVDETWDDGPNRGIVTQSVVVLAVRPGNPKGIKGWDDLIRPDVSIITPNPGSSGAARWNILAAWGHVVANGGTEAEASEFLAKVFRNTDALPGSGREATTAFLAGTGDVLISYENETILARQEGAKLDYIVPDTTLLIENPGAVTKGAHPKAAEWLAFVVGPDGQAEYYKKGFRPLVEGITAPVEGATDPSNPYPQVGKLLTISEDFTSWSEVSKTYFGDDGTITKIQTSTGKK